MEQIIKRERLVAPAVSLAPDASIFILLNIFETFLMAAIMSTYMIV